MQFQLADLYEILCDANPQAEALIAGDRVFTRGELDARANQLAHHLQAHGIRAGDHVGIYAHNRAEWIEALLACWKISAVAININFRYTVHELRYLWANSNIVGLIYECCFAPLVTQLAGEFPELTHYVVLDDDSAITDAPGQPYEAALASHSAARSFPPRSADNIFFIYTGGTTGMPKGVLWRHEDFYFNVITSINEPLTTPEGIVRYSDNPNGMRSLTLSPLMHGGGQFAVLISIYSGGCAAIPVSKSLNPVEVLTIIRKHDITMLSMIGDAMARPIAEAKIDSGVDTSSLAIISSGGAIMTEAARALLVKAFGSDIFITGGIGGSEIGAAAMEGGAFDALSGPRFRPLKNMAVLDDNLNPLSPGTGAIGFLAVTGHIPLGYYKDIEKTAKTFVTDARGQRWVMPGDYARVEDDGSFSLIGRGSQCINSGGEKIFVEEVERAVARHPAVRLCAVVGIADEKWQQRVVVVVELQAGVAGLTLEDIQKTCRHFIAGYKIPRALFIATFKFTDNGKIDYAWARNLAEQSISKSRQTSSGAFQ